MGRPSLEPRALVQIRKPPIDAVFALHRPRKPGKCPWCGQEITERTPIRKQLKTIHERCSFELGIITSPDQARRAVLERDKGICCDCGEDWSQRSKFVPVRHVETKEPHVVFAMAVMRGSPWPPEAYWISTCRERREGHHPFVVLNAISLWHCDHKVPLWKVQRLEPLKRIEYFKLANLVTRCHRCHQFKTDEETAERAKYDRQDPAVKRKQKRRKPWGKRPMRGYQPRPARDINDL